MQNFDRAKFVTISEQRLTRVLPREKRIARLKSIAESAGPDLPGNARLFVFRNKTHRK
jgi:hypothetical protein